MNDLSTVLRDAAQSLDLAPVDDQLVAADVTRARRALGRRRTQRLASRGGVTLGVAAVAVAVAVVPGSGGASPHGPSVASSSPTSAVAGGISLVAYTGTQPDSYRIDTVPAGWTLLSADATSLVIGPAGSRPAGAAARAGETTGAVSLIGDLYVSLRSVDAPGDALPGSVDVPVGSVTGHWGTYEGDDGTKGLTFPSGKNIVEIQVPPSLGWSAGEAAAFATGLHVPEHPGVTRG